MQRYLILVIISITCISAQILGNTNPKLQSLVFPGWGEQALGESKRAQSFFIREAALWLFCIGSMKTENWYKSDYTAFAELHAEVNMDKKPYLFVLNIGHYNSLDEYNDTRERQRLPKEKYYGSEYNWQWDSKANRIKYDKMRIYSVTARKYVKFAVGGLILHRLISFIDVIYLERQSQAFSLDSQIYGDQENIELRLSFKF